MNIVYEYSESVADGVAYFYGLNRTHNSEGEIYVYNAHGDVVQLVKDNSVVANYTYDAFGNLTSQIGESDNPFLYCGEYFDAETQTYYLRARYYNPANGRFNAEDPIKDGLNWYTYCNCNPSRYIDSTGLAAKERLCEGIWSFKSDEYGISILAHWLYGGGTDYVYKDGVWGIYMKENSILKETPTWYNRNSGWLR